MFNRLPSSAIALWYTLLSINNTTGWKTKFNVPNGTVQQMTGLSKQGLTKARDVLVENDLIYYEKGKKGSAPVYQMNSFLNLNGTYRNQFPSTNEDPINVPSDSPSACQYEEQSQLESLSLDQSSDQYDDNTGNIPKQKQKQKQKSSSSSTREDKTPFEIYEENYGKQKPAIKKDVLKWCNVLGNDVVIYAIRVAVKRGGKTFSYLERILTDWSNAALNTLDKVKAYEEQQSQFKQGTVDPYRKREENSNQALYDALNEELVNYDF